MMKFRCLVNIFYVKLQVYRYFSSSLSNIHPNGKYILINGCDTISSHSLAVHLDKQGFHVFAGVYDLKSKFILKNQLSTRATIFPIDITRLEDIRNTYDLMKQETNSLHALINNIDISTIHRLERNTMELMYKKMHRYFFGHVSMTKTFLPLLTSKQNSNIVNIYSVNDIFDLPLQSTYCSMKDSLKSFSDILRRDMAVWNLRVSIIENDSIHTSMMKKHDNLLNKLSINVQEQWDEDFLKIQMNQLIENGFHQATKHPMKVIQAPGWALKFALFPTETTTTWLSDSMLQIKSISRFLSTQVKKQMKDYKLFRILNKK